MPLSKEEHYRDVFITVDNYNETVKTVLAFAALFCYTSAGRRPGAEYGFGRRFGTSATNPVSPNTTVTPDCACQMSTAYGIAAEVKKTMPVDESEWEETAKQLRKYDDDLTGWWTSSGRIQTADAALLIHQSRSRAFVAYLRALDGERSFLRGPKSTVIEFNRSDESQPFIFFRKEFGELQNVEANTALQNGVAVPYKAVLTSFPAIVFYDARPPLEHLMAMLWQDSFAASASELPKDPTDGSQRLVVTVDGLTQELQSAGGSGVLAVDARSAGFPKEGWIRDALDELVACGYATPVNPPGTYTVRYRPLTKANDVLEHFCNLRFDVRNLGSATDADASQTTLPLDLNPT